MLIRHILCELEELVEWICAWFLHRSYDFAVRSIDFDQIWTNFDSTNKKETSEVMGKFFGMRLFCVRHLDWCDLFTVNRTEAPQHRILLYLQIVQTRGYDWIFFDWFDCIYSRISDNNGYNLRNKINTLLWEKGPNRIKSERINNWKFMLAIQSN